MEGVYCIGSYYMGWLSWSWSDPNSSSRLCAANTAPPRFDNPHQIRQESDGLMLMVCHSRAGRACCDGPSFGLNPESWRKRGEYARALALLWRAFYFRTWPHMRKIHANHAGWTWTWTDARRAPRGFKGTDLPNMLAVCHTFVGCSYSPSRAAGW